MSVSVCVSVCVCHVFGTTRPIFTILFVHVTYGCGSVLLWRRSDMLCTSVLWMMSYLRISQAQCTRSLGLGYKLCAVIPGGSSGAESAVYDCLVF